MSFVVWLDCTPQGLHRMNVTLIPTAQQPLCWPSSEKWRMQPMKSPNLQRVEHQKAHQSSIFLWLPVITFTLLAVLMKKFSNNNSCITIVPMDLTNQMLKMCSNNNTLCNEVCWSYLTFILSIGFIVSIDYFVHAKIVAHKKGTFRVRWSSNSNCP